MFLPERVHICTQTRGDGLGGVAGRHLAHVIVHGGQFTVERRDESCGHDPGRGERLGPFDERGIDDIVAAEDEVPVPRQRIAPQSRMFSDAPDRLSQPGP
ncbi:hypothetical protein GCM10020218_012390 [Dactylosporangium vinaceum]